MSGEKTMGQVIQTDEARIQDDLGGMVRGAVEETLNTMLDAEADRLGGAGRYLPQGRHQPANLLQLEEEIRWPFANRDAAVETAGRREQQASQRRR